MGVLISCEIPATKPPQPRHFFGHHQLLLRLLQIIQRGLQLITQGFCFLVRLTLKLKLLFPERNLQFVCEHLLFYLED